MAAFANYLPTEADLKPASSAAPPSPPPAAAAKPVAAPAAAPAAPTPSPSVASGAQANLSRTVGGRIFASPFAKKIAAEKGLDLSKIVGTGPGGRIRSIDLAGAPSLQAGLSFGSPTSPYEDAELTNMRQVIAKRLLQSKQTIPHYYLTAEINVDELLK